MPLILCCVLFLGLSLLILSLPLLGLGSKSTSRSPRFSVHSPRQYNMICWKFDFFFFFFFHNFLFLLGCLFGQMESMDVAGVLQEAGDADSRARTRYSKV